MADKKISALTAASTPLAGTEVLPIVQSGATVKVAVSDLTAGRNVSMADLTTTGNTILGNAQADTLNVGNGDIVKDGVGYTGFGTAPSYKVHILESKTITPTSGDGQLAVVNSSATTTDVAAILFSSQGTRHGQISVGQGTLGNDGFMAFTVRTDASGFVEAARINETADLKINTGNLVIGTSGKGIDFSATAGTGTSELLADYEEGDWTPVDSSGAGLTFTTAAARYTKIGRTVFIQAQITFPSTASVATVLIGGLPFTSSASSRTGLSLGYNTFVANYLPFISASSALVELVTVASGGAQPTNVNLSTQQFAFGGFYTV
jgi:hypothetical protein